MDEQRRVYLAIVLSVVVLMGWQMIMGPQVAPVVPPEVPTEEIAERPALPSSDAAAVPADSAQPAELSAATEVVGPPVVETPAQDFLWGCFNASDLSNEGPSRHESDQYTERDENDVMNPVALTDKLGRQARINVFSNRLARETLKLKKQPQGLSSRDRTQWTHLANGYVALMRVCNRCYP